jgi:hypothetical protein
MNPLLSTEFCMPDVEARSMPDSRLYLYGSLDVSDKVKMTSQGPDPAFSPAENIPASAACELSGCAHVDGAGSC